MLRLALSPLWVLTIAWLALPVGVARGQQSAAPSAASVEEVFPGYTATRTQESFPGIPAESIDRTPLSGPPSILELEHRPVARMSAQDAEVVASMTTELAQRAHAAGFDIGSGGWDYDQIVCPAFPDFVLLAFHQTSDSSGSSRFVAVLERNATWMRIVPTISHGAVLFGTPWSRPGAYPIFNYMLRRERGLRPLGSAPEWLSIAMCYAELGGHHVQVFVPETLPDSTLDMSRLGANQPQLQVDPDQSVEVTFSDAATPVVTTDWLLRFDRRGQIFSVSSSRERQPAKIALRP